MTFHLKSDRYERRKIPVIKGIAILCALLALVQFVFPQFFPALFLRAVGPLWAIPTTDDRDQKIAELQAQVNAHALVEREYAALLGDLGQRIPSDFILGRVLSVPPSTIYDSLLINVGEHDAVMAGQRVFVGNMIAIGTIAEVYQDTSKVSLYSTPGNTFDVIIGVGTTSRATATGRGAGQFEVVVPREAPVSIGDIVTLPSISTAPFGIVSAVIRDPATAFASVLFLGPVPLQSITRVYVEK